MSIPLDQMDDPWTLQPGMPVVLQPEPPTLRIETIEGVVPLDPQIGAFPKKVVPDVLHDALFGQPEPSEVEIGAAGGDPAQVPPLQTYAILDAATVTNLPELLERSRLDHRCLLKGAAYDEMKNVAPWIVRLEEDNAFTRHLFTHSDASWHLWDREPGIYIRSRASLEEVWRHFRLFIRVQDECEKWYWLKFWEPRCACRLTDYQATRELLIRLLSGDKAIIAISRHQPSRASIMTVKQSAQQPRMGHFVLARDMRVAFSDIVHRNAQEDLALQSCSQMENGSNYDRELERVGQRWQWLQNHGMSEPASLRRACAALLKISTDEMLRHEDVRAVVTASRIGDAMKARLIERAVSA